MVVQNYVKLFIFVGETIFQNFPTIIIILFF